MNKLRQAFTLVELIVVITILAILGTIAFISLQGYSKTARDSRRVSDISNIKTALELFILDAGNYPQPDVDGTGAVYYSGDLLWTQGTVGNNVITNLSKNLQNKPLDPLFDIEYVYSITSTKNEYQLMAVYESEVSKINSLINFSYAENTYKIKVEGNYNEIFIKTKKYIVPTPSIIISEDLPVDFKSNAEILSSMVTTNGKNFPNINIPNTTVEKGQLNINLFVYTGSITKNITTEEKRKIITAIQNTYTGSDLSTQAIYKNILTTTNPENLADELVLKIISSSSSNTNTCDIGYIWDGSLCRILVEGSTNIDFDTEGSYIQQDATIGTDFGSGVVSLHDSGIGGNDSYTKLLVHGNGTNDSTTFTDSSSYNKTVSTIGNVKVKTDRSKFGGSSMYFPGGIGNYLEIVNNPDFSFGTGDFTIEMWAMFNDNTLPTSSVGIMSFNSSNYWMLNYQTNGYGWIFYSALGVSNGSGGSNPVRNIWKHIAVIRHNSILKIYIDGIQLISVSNSRNINVDNNPVKIGGYSDADAGFNGWMDEVRISKGIARRTADFTPPTTEYGVAIYPTSESYYITTSDSSQIDTSTYLHISRISITQTIPSNTNLKYLVSFDGRNSWKYWDGSSWETSNLANINTNGMTKSTIESITQSQWEVNGGFIPGTTTTLDFAIDMESTDSSVTPSLDNIGINWLN